MRIYFVFENFKDDKQLKEIIILLPTKCIFNINLEEILSSILGVRMECNIFTNIYKK